MLLRFRQLIKILRFLMFHVKHRLCTAYKQHHKSTRNLHLLAVFFLLAVFSMLLCDTAHASENLDISKVIVNGVTLNDNGNGVYTGVCGSSGLSNMQIQIYSNNIEPNLNYNLDCTFTLTYPQTSNSYVNITPFAQNASGVTSYRSNIGRVSFDGSNVAYKTQAQLASAGYPFTHGGYTGSPTTSGTVINTDLDFQFTSNDITFLGLFLETCDDNHTLKSFSNSSRQFTITINHLTESEVATIKNAETTKNIFEWLKDGFVNLIVPTSDGIEEMLDSTSSTLESRLGILYLPIRFAGELLGVLTASLEGAVTGQSITVPEWNMSLFGHNYIIWHQTTFSMSDNAIFHYIVFDLGLIFLVRIGYLLAMFTSIILTINTCSDNMIDEEFAHFMTAEERDMWLSPLQTYNLDDDEGGGDF